MQAHWPRQPLVVAGRLVTRREDRQPPAAPDRDSCAPGCGRSRRAKTRIFSVQEAHVAELTGLLREGPGGDQLEARPSSATRAWLAPAPSQVTISLRRSAGGSAVIASPGRRR
jgi:hypothetical protein